MRNRIFNISLALIFGFLLACVFFFPWNRLKDQLAVLISKKSRVNFYASSLEGTTGFVNGVKFGSLVGLKAQNMQIRTSDGGVFSCPEFVAAPKILPLFWGQFHVGLKCNDDQGGSLKSLIKLKPFWAPKDVNGEALLDQYSLGNLATLKKGLSLEGAGSGDLDFTHKLDGSIPVKVNMDLGIDRLKLPGLNHALIKIPPLKFSTSKINGSVEAGKTLKFESLELGRKSDKIHLDLNFDFGLDRSGMPTSGNLAGRLKVDPEFEKNELASIKTELIFGPVKASGYREFKQVVKGSLMPFLLGIKQ